jgi:hypothetical protein
MTAAAGAALSYLLWLHRLGGNISSESDAAIPAAGNALAIIGEHNRSSLLCMDPMSCRRERQGPRAIRSCELLAQTSSKQAMTSLVSISK